MSGKQRQEATVSVPSKDQEKEKEKDKKKDGEKVAAKSLPDNVKDPGSEDLSEEDRALKERLDLFVERLFDKDNNISDKALESLKDEIRTATSSMTSVPKPLKFLNAHYEKIKEFYNEITDLARKIIFSDLMSVLAMTMEEPETRRCLKYRLDSGDQSIDPWGSQYVKHLAAEIGFEMRDKLAAEQDADKLDGLIDMKEIMRVTEDIVRFYMKNNSEPEACDILMEVEALDMIEKYCEDHNHSRTCEYLRSCANYHPYPEDMHIYQICFDLYFKFKSYLHALRFALKLDNKKLVHRVMKTCSRDKTQLRQCAYLLGWHQYGYDEDEEISDDDVDVDTDMKNNDDDDDDEDEDDDDDDLPEISEIVCNIPLCDAFHGLAKDLDVEDPKDPETDIFKEQLVTDVSQNIISAKKSLAITYVNAFVNAGYGKDKFMVSGDNKDADNWIAKNKERGQMAAVASVGTIMLWDEDAVNRVDRYFESEQNQIRAGAFLAIGLACSGMRSEAGLGYALLNKPASGEGKKTTTNLERIAATFGLGMAYAGQENEDVYETLSELVSIEQGETLSSIAALSCGLVYVGTCNNDISNLILADLMEREPEKLDNPLYLLNALGLGLLFLQRQEDVETTLEAVEVFNDMNPKFAKTMKTTLETLAYAGTGNVLKVQQFLEIVGEHFDEEDAKKAEEEKKKNEAESGANAAGGAGARGGPQSALQRQLQAAQGGAAAGGGAAAAGGDDDEKKEEVNDHRYFQSIATLGIALVAMGEDLGSEMTLRMFSHLVQYGNTRVKRAVPLALSLLCVSNPKLEVMDTLSKLSHDADAQVAQGAILGLGIIGAGTNNARIAGMLRSLTVYYAKDADHLYLVRVAQGLIHTGKGLMTIQPFHSDRFLMSKVALCGILTVLFASIDLNDSLLGEKHYLLYALVLALKPRMLVTLDEKLKSLKTSVRVGQALDVVGQAGRPKAITGFQTHDTPVLLGYQERAELASDEYISATPVLEGFAILKPNPDADSKKSKKNKEKQ